MKNLIIGICIGLLINGIVAFAKPLFYSTGWIDVPFPGMGTYTPISTTVIKTPEGSYRLFIHDGAKGISSITAVKIGGTK